MLSKSIVIPRLTSGLAVRRFFQTSPVVNSGHEYWWSPEKANGREVVGHGASNQEDYEDRLDFWYPGIRFQKDDGVILPIKEKEMGDWKNLSIDEKKLLYRYSYRQTLSEFLAPNGYWKPILGSFICIVSLTALYTSFLKVYAWPKPPPTYDTEYKEAETERELVLKKGFMESPAINFNYETNKWK